MGGFRARCVGVRVLGFKVLGIRLSDVGSTLMDSVWPLI